MVKDEEVKKRIAQEVPLRELERVLEDAVERSDTELEVLRKIEGYSNDLVTGNGKRFRVAVPYIMAQGLDVDMDEEEIMEVLIPLELVHGLSLILDDVIDQDETRRGMKTPHEKFRSLGFSERQAKSIATLDVMHLQSMAQEVVLDLELDEQRKIEISKVVAETLKKISRGQILDVSGETIYRGEKFRDMLSEEGAEFDYREFYSNVVNGKTTPLIEAGPKILEVLREEELPALKEYSRSLGKAFQIRDDVLDITAGEDEIKPDLEGSGIGKDRFSDLMEGTVTLPVYYALENGGSTFEQEEEFLESVLPEDLDLEEFRRKNPHSKKFLKSVLGERDPEAYELLIAGKIVERSGALQKANQEAQKKAEEAVKSLERSKVEDKELELLEKLAYFAATRSK